MALSQARANFEPPIYNVMYFAALQHDFLYISKYLMHLYEYGDFYNGRLVCIHTYRKIC